MHRVLAIIMTVLLVLAAAPLAFALDVGDQAPRFDARTTRGDISSDGYLGKKNVVLSFYIKDYAPFASEEMKAFASNITEFERLDAQVIGASPSLWETHMRLVSDLGLTFPVVWDTKGELQVLYGVTGVETLVIDKKGVIRYIRKGPPDIQEILKVLEGLQ